MDGESDSGAVPNRDALKLHVGVQQYGDRKIRSRNRKYIICERPTDIACGSFYVPDVEPTTNV